MRQHRPTVHTCTRDDRFKHAWEVHAAPSTPLTLRQTKCTLLDGETNGDCSSGLASTDAEKRDGDDNDDARAPVMLCATGGLGERSSGGVWRNDRGEWTGSMAMRRTAEVGERLGAEGEGDEGSEVGDIEGSSDEAIYGRWADTAGRGCWVRKVAVATAAAKLSGLSTSRKPVFQLKDHRS